MKSVKFSRIQGELATILLFILFLFPFVLVLLNSAGEHYKEHQDHLDERQHPLSVVPVLLLRHHHQFPRVPQSPVGPGRVGPGAHQDEAVEHRVLHLRRGDGHSLPDRHVSAPHLAEDHHRLYRDQAPADLCRDDHLLCRIRHLAFHLHVPRLHKEHPARARGSRDDRRLQAARDTVAVLNGIWIWNDYLLPLLVLGKGNAIQTLPLAVSNFAGAFVKQWDLIMTAVLLAMIPIIICFLLAQKYIVKGMLAGSIK